MKGKIISIFKVIKPKKSKTHLTKEQAEKNANNPEIMAQVIENLKKL